MKDLNRRNTETVEQKLKEMDSAIREQQIRIDTFVTAVSSLTARIQALETQMMIWKVKSTSHGPTVV